MATKNMDDPGLISVADPSNLGKKCVLCKRALAKRRSLQLVSLRTDTEHHLSTKKIIFEKLGPIQLLLGPLHRICQACYIKSHRVNSYTFDSNDEQTSNFRCVNCQVNISRLKRHNVHNNDDILELLQKRFGPLEVPKDSWLCDKCLDVLSKDPSDKTLGYPMICIACGVSVRNKKNRKKIEADSPLLPYLNVPDTYQFSESEYACYNCWCKATSKRETEDECKKDNPDLSLNLDPEISVQELWSVLDQEAVTESTSSKVIQKPDIETKVCRFCLRKGQHKFCLNSILEFIVFKLFNINLIKSSHSSICNACMISFKEALKFRNQVIETEKKIGHLNVDYENVHDLELDIKDENVFGEDNVSPLSPSLSDNVSEQGNKENSPTKGKSVVRKSSRISAKKELVENLNKKNHNLAPEQGQNDLLQDNTILDDENSNDIKINIQEVECDLQLECDDDFDERNTKSYDQTESCDQENDQIETQDQEEDVVLIENIEQEPICIESGDESDSSSETSDFENELPKFVRRIEDEDSDYVPIKERPQRKRTYRKKSDNNERSKRKRGNRFSNLLPSQYDDVSEERFKLNTNLYLILKHSNAVHFHDLTELGYSCGHCRDKFLDPEDLRSHVAETHRNDKNRVVSTDFINSIKKLDITGLKCNLCELAFDHLKPFKDHLVENHGKKFYADIIDQIVEFKLKKGGMHDCSLCSASYESFRALISHMNSHYKNFECDSCGQVFILKKSLESHKIIHSEPSFKCKYCDKTFKTVSYKMNHEKTVHLNINIKEVSCNICNEKFKNQFIKNVHLIKEHNLGRKYQCKVCSKSYVAKYLLNNHTRRVHLMEREIQCPYCDMKFFQKRYLENHLIKHDKDKILYECDLCGKKYVRKYALRVHLREHYDDKRFKCHICDVRFVQKSGLQNHLKSKHDIIMIASEINPS